MDKRLLKTYLRNFPVPEPIIGAILGGIGLHVLAPLPLIPNRPMIRKAGAGCLAIGGTVIVRSTAEAMNMRIAEPERLLTTGAYRWSRNPMYLGWLAVTVGIGLLLRMFWVILGSAAAFIVFDRITIPGEEQTLTEHFGEAYEAYCDRVPRYL